MLKDRRMSVGVLATAVQQFLLLHTNNGTATDTNKKIHKLYESKPKHMVKLGIQEKVK